MGEKQKDEASGDINGEKQNKALAVQEKKNKGNDSLVVFKIDLHCEGCVRKVLKIVRKVAGVESVDGDIATNKLTVKGSLDAEKLRDRIQAKTRKKVDLISPLPNKQQQQQDKKQNNAAAALAEKMKTKEPQVSTVLFKIRLHCEGCTHRIRKIIRKYKGVHTVEIDAEKDLVTVKGTMDVKEMHQYLKKKLKRSVEIVPPKKEGAAAQDNKAGDQAAKKGKGNGGPDNTKPGPGGLPTGYGEYAFQNPNGYVIEYVHAPQIFSDENPNACLIM